VDGGVLLEISCREVLVVVYLDTLRFSVTPESPAMLRFSVTLAPAGDMVFRNIIMLRFSVTG
jgi:hypothetical protein